MPSKKSEKEPVYYEREKSSGGWYNRRVFIRTRMPIAALQLAEDTMAIKQAIALLKDVEYQNITDQEERGRTIHQMVLTMLRTWERYARLKMRENYLKE